MIDIQTEGKDGREGKPIIRKREKEQEQSIRRLKDKGVVKERQKAGKQKGRWANGEKERKERDRERGRERQMYKWKDIDTRRERNREA